MRLGIIRDTQEWLGAGGLRNRLVHEYIDDLDALAASLDVARRFTTVLIEAAHAFRSYAEQRLGVPAARPAALTSAEVGRARIEASLARMEHNAIRGRRSG